MEIISFYTGRASRLIVISQVYVGQMELKQTDNEASFRAQSIPYFDHLLKSSDNLFSFIYAH